jgi:propanol-preferring alcohol dehydrogenase
MVNDMHAMALGKPRSVAFKPLHLVERSAPEPAEGEIQVRVEVCGVCRTDLHVVEGDLSPHRDSLIPGHEVVGRVTKVGPGCTRFAEGARIGIAWLRGTCGVCRFCRRGAENLCLEPRFTGWDEDGGYSELAVVPEAFAYALPDDLPATELAPLLCAGIIGYRAYRRCRIQPGGRLGLFGFGGSAHVTIQVARHDDCEVYVFSRGGEHRELAEELGAAWVGDSFDRPPHPLDAAILFAPAGELVLPALETLDRGATLAIAGIHLSDVPVLDYQKHLFQERSLRSVTANTREDGRRLLELAAAIPIRTRTRVYSLEQANEALLDLKEDRVRGAAVLKVG